MKLFPVILSGGSGTRLWPISRKLFPKQLVQLTGNLSLFQKTLERCSELRLNNKIDVQAPIIVCNEQHRFLIAQQAQDLNVDLTTIILEPAAKNTAPALTLAAMYLKEHHPDSIMLVLPADHAIEDTKAFIDVVSEATLGQIKSNDNLHVFGIEPTYAHTGYGYIEATLANTLPYSVSAFKEKPNEQLAQQYVSSGEYFWNSGMFMLSAELWITALDLFIPAINDSCEKAMKSSVKDLDFTRVDQAYFLESPSESIDYAVIENIAELRKNNIDIVMSPLNCGWTDLGAWTSVSDYLPSDKDGNVNVGDVIQESSKNTFVMSQHRLVATVGVENLIVVETPDAVLVTNKENAQNVKSIVDRLSNTKRDEHLVHRRVYRPWGNYETVDFGERFQVKRIIVNPGASLSLQMHHHRAEHWIVVKGTAEVTCDDDVFLLSENESTYIPIGSTHRLINPGKLPLELIEVQSGSYLGEDDIVRFEDIYGREQEKVIG